MYLEDACHTTQSISVTNNRTIDPLVAPSTNFFITALHIKSLFPAISYLNYLGIVEVRVFLSKPVVDRFHLLPEWLLVWIDHFHPRIRLHLHRFQFRSCPQLMLIGYRFFYGLAEPLLLAAGKALPDGCV